MSHYLDNIPIGKPATSNNPDVGNVYVFYDKFGGLYTKLSNGTIVPFVIKNVDIVAATKTKLTYDAKGLITSGVDATTADIAPSTDRNYVTDAKSIVLGNTYGANNGDETGVTIGIINANAASKITPVDADSVVGVDSVAGNVIKRFTFTNIKAFLKTYFDTLYASLTGFSLTGVMNEAKGINIASAATTNIATATGNYVVVTGTTTITALGTAQAGSRRIVQFSGILTLTHNATSLILPTAANIITAVGDIAVFISEGSGNWRCAGYTRADGKALVSNGTFTGPIILGNAIYPPILTTSQDDYNPTGWSNSNLVFLSASSNVEITGFAAPSPDVAQFKILTNLGTGDVKLKNLNAGSIITNRIRCFNDSDQNMKKGAGMLIVRDVVNSVWIAILRL
jgi:hypothetical protein